LSELTEIIAVVNEQLLPGVDGSRQRRFDEKGPLQSLAMKRYPKLIDIADSLHAVVLRVSAAVVAAEFMPGLGKTYV
jgi:hypothetical protein